MSGINGVKTKLQSLENDYKKMSKRYGSYFITIYVKMFVFGVIYIWVGRLIQQENFNQLHQLLIFHKIGIYALTSPKYRLDSLNAQDKSDENVLFLTKHDLRLKHKTNTSRLSSRNPCEIKFFFYRCMQHRNDYRKMLYSQLVSPSVFSAQCLCFIFYIQL